MDALTQTFATLGISIAALTAGKHLARVLPVNVIVDFLESANSKRHQQNSRSAISSSQSQNGDARRTQEHKASVYPPSGQNTRLIPPSTRSHIPLTPIVDVFCFLVLGVGFWIGAILLAALPPQANFRPLTFALVFSPPGAILRWYLSSFNSAKGSKRFPYWPLGTFSANILAVLIICALFVGQHYGPTGTRLAASTTVSCQVLYGLQEGFCGCLSTISTFAVELRNLKPKRRAVGYAVGSYVIGIAICVLIIGAPWWARGMDGSCEGLLSYPK
jgi:fluoride ion exporter CrcB/FEX